MAYKSSYTGPQIDQAVGNALNKDTSTLSNDVNHIPASSVVKSALNTVDESIAIRVSGSKTTHASGAAIGQYVIVSDSAIPGIADGMYKAVKAIPYNTVIDSTYLTAVSGGGLNDLKSALDRLRLQYYSATVDLSDLTWVARTGCWTASKTLSSLFGATDVVFITVTGYGGIPAYVFMDGYSAVFTQWASGSPTGTITIRGWRNQIEAY